MKYEIQAGRCIMREGVPFATLHGVGNYSPTELDTLARKVVAQLNTHDELVAALETVARGVSPDMDTKDCDYLRAIARAALAKVTNAE